MAAKYDFPPIYKGDTFKERKLKISRNGEATDLTDALISFKLSTKSNRFVVDVPTTNTDPLNGEITLNKWDIDIDDYTYNYQIKITIGETTLTYLTGSFTVLNSTECR